MSDGKIRHFTESKPLYQLPKKFVAGNYIWQLALPNLVQFCPREFLDKQVKQALLVVMFLCNCFLWTNKWWWWWNI